LNIITLLMLLSILLLPEFFVVNFDAESASTGSLIAYLVIIILIAFTAHKKLFYIKRFTITLISVITIATILSIIGGIIAGTTFDIVKFGGSFLLLIMQLYTAQLLYMELQGLSGEAIDNISKKIVGILLAIGSYYGYKLNFNPSGNARMFFFTEPSHFATHIAPFLIYLLITLRTSSTLVLAIFTSLLSILLSSSTLLIALFVGSSIRFLKMKNMWDRIALFSIIASGFILGLIQYFVDRFNAVLVADNDSQNISGIVYIQGWEFIYSTLQKGFLFGIGLNQMGNIELDSVAADALIEMDLPLNWNDGSFLLSKLVVELGMFGMFFAIFYIVILVRTIKLIQARVIQSSFDAYYKKNIFFWSLGIAFLIPLVIRNTNYFNATVTLFIVFLFYFYTYIKKH